MNYKFYIYCQSVLVNFDKYDLTEYSLLREITQNSKWGLKIERDREWFTVIRRTFSGEVTVKGTDFDALIATEGDVKQYALVIHRECAGVYTEFWKGYFSYFDFKVDLDTCYLTFEPTVWDEYSLIYDQIPMERNILALSDGEGVFIHSYEWSYEDIISRRTVAFGGGPTWHEYDLEPIAYPPGNMYYLYSRTYYTSEFPLIYYRVEEYRRDWALNDSDVVTPPGTNWVLDPQLPGPGEYSPGLWKYVRPYQNAVSGTYISYQAPPEIYYGFIQDLNLSPTDVINGCITLSSVLNYFAGYIKLVYASDFFTDTPCPIGGTSLSLTMLTQISNIRDTTEWAVRGMMKLGDLLAWIRDTFNAYWYIDSNGDFRIEHRKYFDYGLSYTYTHVIELDLAATYPVQIKHLNKYEWDKPELYRFEKLEFPYAYFNDWMYATLEYPQLSIMGNETNVKSVVWDTDVISVMNDAENLSKQGWVLLDVFWNWSGGVGVKQVRDTVGAITGIAVQNGRFSTSNIYRDFWGWGRILPTGNVNGNLTTFGSIEKLRKQVTLSIPQCCVDLDYNGLFRTELGDGLIDSAEYEQNGTLKLNLIYE